MSDGPSLVPVGLLVTYAYSLRKLTSAPKKPFRQAPPSLVNNCSGQTFARMAWAYMGEWVLKVLLSSMVRNKMEQACGSRTDVPIFSCLGISLVGLWLLLILAS